MPITEGAGYVAPKKTYDPLEAILQAAAAGRKPTASAGIGFGNYGTAPQYKDYVNQLYAGLDPTRSWLPNVTGESYGQFGGSLAYLNNLSSGGGGGGYPLPAMPSAPPELKPLHDIQWVIDESLRDPRGMAPNWWVPLRPQDVSEAERPDVQALMFLNTMLPFLSPEDQRNAAAQLYTTAADAFSYYKGEKLPAEVGGAPFDWDTIMASSQSGLTPINRRYFESTARAQGALDALSRMREATVQGNRWKLGPGYTYLQNVINAVGRYGTDVKNPDVRMTKTQQQAMLGALDPLLSQGQSQETATAAAVARMFAMPFFSQSPLIKQMSSPTGGTRLGGINPLFFG